MTELIEYDAEFHNNSEAYLFLFSVSLVLNIYQYYISL